MLPLGWIHGTKFPRHSMDHVIRFLVTSCSLTNYTCCFLCSQTLNDKYRALHIYSEGQPCRACRARVENMKPCAIYNPRNLDRGSVTNRGAGISLPSTLSKEQKGPFRETLEERHATKLNEARDHVERPSCMIDRTCGSNCCEKGLLLQPGSSSATRSHWPGRHPKAN